MGLNVGSINHTRLGVPAIDTQALAKVTEQILNPNSEKTIDVSKLDLSKFNRASLGTDLYAGRTNGEVALQAAKAATDFDLNLSQTFSQNVQYLNSQAAQSLFTVKDVNGLASVSIENIQVNEKDVITEISQVNETKDMNKDKKGSNPFSFYMPANESAEKKEESDSIFGSINIFA